MRNILKTALAAVILATAGAGTARAQGADCNLEEDDFWRETTAKDLVEDLVDCIAAGADINARDNYGRTPLHDVLPSHVSEEVLRALIDAGADIKAQTTDGKIPADLAEEDNEAVHSVRCSGN
ncbi:MAG: hypothetical protein GDA52_00335 [Rhodobacteraceae bacterium]|nr:hypothetical protein [Paracoccaceae bacterium]